MSVAAATYFLTALGVEEPRTEPLQLRYQRFKASSRRSVAPPRRCTPSVEEYSDMAAPEPAPAPTGAPRARDKGVAFGPTVNPAPSQSREEFLQSARILIEDILPEADILKMLLQSIFSALAEGGRNIHLYE